MKSQTLAACALIAVVAAANAQMSPNMAMPKQASTPASASTVLTDGVVQSLDKSRGVVTLKHGEIANMGMPPMTMGFNVADKKLLDKVKTGDKVRFRVENVNGSPTVIRIEAAQ